MLPLIVMLVFSGCINAEYDLTFFANTTSECSTSDQTLFLEAANLVYCEVFGGDCNHLSSANEQRFP